MIVEKEFFWAMQQALTTEMALKTGRSIIWMHAQNALERKSYTQAAVVDWRFSLSLWSAVWMSTETEHIWLDQFLLRPASGTGKE